MSATTTPPTTVSFFAEAKAMAFHAAATVYHRIVAIESDVAGWVSSSGVQPLLTEGITYLSALLTANNVPVTALVTAEQGLMGALATMAAQDVTVPSGGSATSVMQTAPAVAAVAAALTLEGSTSGAVTVTVPAAAA
jgi:hypothetical protein